MCSKYKNQVCYYNSDLKSIIPYDIGGKVNGYERFASKWELKVYILLSQFTTVVREPTYGIATGLIKPDFQIVNQGKVYIVEAKGFPTANWKIKWKLFQVEYPWFTFFLVANPRDYNQLERTLKTVFN